MNLLFIKPFFSNLSCGQCYRYVVMLCYAIVWPCSSLHFIFLFGFKTKSKHLTFYLHVIYYGTPLAAALAAVSAL